MSYTLADCIRLVVAPYISPVLIAPDALAQICDVARYLPNAITSGYGFECRLGEPEPTADFSFYVVGGTGRDVLAGVHDTDSLDARLLQHPLWQRLQLFAQDWRNPNSLLYPNLKNVWLEFDIVPSMPEIPLPNFFFRPDCRSQPPEPFGQRYLAVLERILETLLERPLSPSVKKMFLKTVELLPGSGYIFQMGMLLIREVQSLRVCVRDISLKEVPVYLHQLGWKDQASQFDDLLVRLSGRVDRIDLALDVDESILQRIGLECYFLDPGTIMLRQRAYLDWLEDAKLCLPEKREALKTYNGYITNPGDRNSWPEHIRSTSFLLGHHRWIHHFKINYFPSGMVEAKAYIGAHQTWIDIEQAIALKQQRTSASFKSILHHMRKSLIDL